MVNEKVNEKEIQISSPYNDDWVKRARELGGKFDQDARVWTFAVEHAEAVREAVRRVYGARPAREGEARVAVRLTAKDSIVADRGPVTWQGYVIASARGRDTGARMGPHAVLLSGSVRSGGSRINWDTRVSKGAVVEIAGVPVSAVADTGDWSVEIVGAAAVEIDRDALISERAALLARLAEIDAALSTEAIAAE